MLELEAQGAPKERTTEAKGKEREQRSAVSPRPNKTGPLNRRTVSRLSRLFEKSTGSTPDSKRKSKRKTVAKVRQPAKVATIASSKEDSTEIIVQEKKLYKGEKSGRREVLSTPNVSSPSLFRHPPQVREGSWRDQKRDEKYKNAEPRATAKNKEGGRGQGGSQYPKYALSLSSSGLPSSVGGGGRLRTNYVNKKGQPTVDHNRR